MTKKEPAAKNFPSITCKVREGRRQQQFNGPAFLLFRKETHRDHGNHEQHDDAHRAQKTPLIMPGMSIGRGPSCWAASGRSEPSASPGREWSERKSRQENEYCENNVGDWGSEVRAQFAFDDGKHVSHKLEGKWVITFPSFLPLPPWSIQENVFEAHTGGLELEQTQPLCTIVRARSLRMSPRSSPSTWNRFETVVSATLRTSITPGVALSFAITSEAGPRTSTKIRSAPWTWNLRFWVYPLHDPALVDNDDAMARLLHLRQDVRRQDHGMISGKLLNKSRTSWICFGRVRWLARPGSEPADRSPAPGPGRAALLISFDNFAMMRSLTSVTLGTRITAHFVIQIRFGHALILATNRRYP